MKKRPILFSAPMVRALLDGSKTQTRRIVKWSGPKGFPHFFDAAFVDSPAGVNRLCVPYHHPDDQDSADGNPSHRHYCPYGDPGDRLWVRESFAIEMMLRSERSASVLFKADGAFYRAYSADKRHHVSAFRDSWVLQGRDKGHCFAPSKFKPSIHMPRWASRITLEITGVRIERLQDISEADAAAEGVDFGPDKRHAWGQNKKWLAGHCRDCEGWNPAAKQKTAACGYFHGDETDVRDHRGAGCSTSFVLRKSSEPKKFQFEFLWTEINGASSWDANPWVWVLEFKRVGDLTDQEPMIDGYPLWSGLPPRKVIA